VLFRIVLFDQISILEAQGFRTSFADPGCLSWILTIFHPGYQISDPGSSNNNKRRGKEKKCCPTFAKNFLKLKKLFYFWAGKERNLSHWQRIKLKYFVPTNIFTKLSEIWVGDPEKKYPQNPSSGTRDLKSTRSQIRICNTDWRLD
jgi:hypothetical protein